MELGHAGADVMPGRGADGVGVRTWPMTLFPHPLTAAEETPADTTSGNHNFTEKPIINTTLSIQECTKESALPTRRVFTTKPAKPPGHSQ